MADISDFDYGKLRDLPARVRAMSPLVHCMTNLVVSNFTANVLLAVGASPAMVVAPEETGEFAAIADALLVNLGTIDAQQLLAMRLAVAGANQAGKPWILDPITAGLSFRMNAARLLLALSPAVIRGNASEIGALASSGQTKSRGVDSLGPAEEALEAALALALEGRTVVAVSGETDYVVDGARTLAIPGGHVLMTQVTGVGCALNAVIAAYVAVTRDPFLGTAGALLAFATAGEAAAKNAAGPGSFAVDFLDQLSQLETLPLLHGAAA